jgi:thioredoxin-related protein
MGTQKLWAAAILACGLGLPARAAEPVEVPLARDLRAESRPAERRKVPVLILFASPGCHFCHRVRAEYLEPMLRDPAYRDKVVIREIEVGGDQPLLDFDGRETTHGVFAAQQKVRMVPTVKFFDARGRQVADPIVGLLIADYYFGYLDAAINEGTGRIRARRASLLSP